MPGKKDNGNKPCYGLLKAGHDAHTLGLSHVGQLLEECGFIVHVAGAEICNALDKVSHQSFFSMIKKWIIDNHITHLGFSYRLDPRQGVETFSRLVYLIDQDPQLSPEKKGQIKLISFAGLPSACDMVKKEFGKRIPVFRGDESPKDVLLNLGVPEKLVPKTVLENSVYDEMRLSFGKELINKEKHLSVRPPRKYSYSGFGTNKDHLVKRLKAARDFNQLPLLRTHVGPYLKEREKALALFSEWIKKLARNGYLDILSIGSSQLSQSHFGENWDGLSNGGGVPFNSPLELRAIREDASPMLIRAYSATNKIPEVARILEENLNMAWHALSIWWFNRIDGRGPLSVKEGISQHLETIKYVADVGKPFEPNIPHHFAFRGSDDVSFIASAFLAAKMAKKLGIKYLVLQNMLNTPRSTWGIGDLIKGRALIKMVRCLENSNFRVIYQPRAGLDYLSPDLDKAKAQLAAVTALMKDMEPDNPFSLEIIHVVSYSEAQFLATPDVIDESLKITKASLKHYPEFKKKNHIRELILNREIKEKTEELSEEVRLLVDDAEKSIPSLYSAEGLYQVFKRGYFPVPFLWEGREEFSNAVKWNTRIIDGAVAVVDENGKKMSISRRLERIKELNSKIEF